ncbi:hypothetical protein GCM10022378_11200 [Salinicoccus jeotgali]|uniref:DUF3102 domain-containing protein n=1 Tax=Salinicoccus jeotgali TaxID=381634 RepID=A0ABP7EQJ8_9STAP
MNEIQTNNFDYSVLDSSTAEYLKDRENSMSKTLENAAEKLGEDLTKAKEKLSKKGYGCFEDWYTSLGLKTTSVYRYINRYEFVSSKLEDSKMLETFQELTPSLQNEMSKPSANPEVNQKVFDGDIKTHKEYRELEKQLKQQEEALKQRDSVIQSTQRENEILQSKVDEAENKEPEIKTVYKEKVPKYIEQQMSDKERELLDSKRSIAQLESELRKAKENQEKMQRVEEVDEETQIGSRRFQAESNVLFLKENINDFLEENSVNAFREGAIATSSQRTKDNLLQGVEELEAFCRAMRTALNNRITVN